MPLTVTIADTPAPEIPVVLPIMNQSSQGPEHSRARHLRQDQYTLVPAGGELSVNVDMIQTTFTEDDAEVGEYVDPFAGREPVETFSADTDKIVRRGTRRALLSALTRPAKRARRGPIFDPDDYTGYPE